MPDARLRRGVSAHTTADLDVSHPVGGTVARTDTGRVTASLDIGEPGDS